MKIETLNASSYEDYEKFLLSQEHSLFYHSVRYKNFLEDLLDCESKYFLAYENNEIVAALPLMIKNGLLGKVVNSLPYYGSNGGVLSKNQTYSKILLSEYNHFISEENIVSATYIENPLEKNENIPFHNSTDTRTGQFTFIDCFENFEEETFKRISGNRRNEIRRAQKHGVKVFEENDRLEFICLTHQNEMKEKNRKYKSEYFFDKIKKHFIPGEDYKVFIAYLDDKPIAGLLMFYFNRVAEYFTPVIISNARIYQPMSLILYHVFIDAMRRGYKWLNWGGTWLSQEGVYNFKKQMGAVDRPYNYHIKINKPEILKLDPADILSMYPDFYVFNFNDRSLIK